MWKSCCYTWRVKRVQWWRVNLDAKQPEQASRISDLMSDPNTPPKCSITMRHSCLFVIFSLSLLLNCTSSQLRIWGQWWVWWRNKHVLSSHSWSWKACSRRAGVPSLHSIFCFHIGRVTGLQVDLMGRKRFGRCGLCFSGGETISWLCKLNPNDRPER